MGRSRGVTNTADEDPSQRSKRRRSASSGENLENVATGPGTSDGKKALYHCNYCNKDISGKIRIKCTKCPDFDLCVECFTVGAEVHPHKSNHPYRVMDSLNFPLLCPDWNADEEILLLEGIEMYGWGNWAEVAEHVGTKSKGECIDHYTSHFMNSSCYPLPDMSHVAGKNRKELLAMAKGHGDGKKGFTAAGEIILKEESPFSPSRVKVEDSSRDASADGDYGETKISGVPSNSTNASSAGASKKASNSVHLKDSSDRIKPEDGQVDRSIGVKKPKYFGDEGPSMTEMSGYNPKRQEFDPEYDYDAEQLLAEMEFKDTDSETERELKLQILRIYSSRLDERKRRKDFILERKLLHPNPMGLSDEDREIYERYKVFMRFHSQEEHEDLIRCLIEECRIRKRIQELQDAKAAGFRLRAEVDIYLAEKARRELEINARKANETDQAAASSKVLQRTNRPMNREKGEPNEGLRSTVDNHKTKGSKGVESNAKDLTSMTMGQVSAKPLEEWDITGLPGAELLSETEQQLCCQNRLLPTHFLKMQEVLVKEVLKGNMLQKSDAHGLFKVDPTKVDRVYDVVTRKLGMREDPPAVV